LEKPLFSGVRILVPDNFRRRTGYGRKRFREMRLWRWDKGHAAEVAAFVATVGKGGPTPIPFEEVVEVTRTTLDIARIILR
jgi:hypothetical protein